MIEIHSHEDWYRNRPEPEKSWLGVLRTREAAVGPQSRASLSYLLEAKNCQLPVYAAGAVELLTPFVDKSVLVYGKLVDLTGEGFTQEIWIGTIEAVAEET